MRHSNRIWIVIPFIVLLLLNLILLWMYIYNIIKFIESDFKQPYKNEIVRWIWIVIPPVWIIVSPINLWN